MLRLLQSDEGTISVLIVSQIPGDHDELRRMLCGSPWRLFSASDSRSALRQLRRKRGIALVLCDREFWKDLLSSVSEMREPPLVIVTARDADEQLWAEALNIGAYDVLAKPFAVAEVVRSLQLGWRYRQRERGRLRALGTAPAGCSL